VATNPTDDSAIAATGTGCTNEGQSPADLSQVALKALDRVDRSAQGKRCTAKSFGIIGGDKVHPN
jgi:hypothetical protein